MSSRNRGIGEPMHIDELKGYDGFVDRIGSGLRTRDVFMLMFKRSRFVLGIIAIVVFIFTFPFLAIDPIGWMVMMGCFFLFLGFMVGMIFLVLKDKLVVQNQIDMMAHILRNDIPLKSIAKIERATDDYLEERKRRTNICTRFFTGTYDLPIGGLHPIASRIEYLLVFHLKEPLEVHCSGRNANGMYQFGDKREYVKEVIISVDPSAQERLVRFIMEKSS